MSMTLPAPQSADAGWIPQTILVVSDSISATQIISFGRPFATGLQSPAVHFETMAKEMSAIRNRFAEIAPDVLILSRMTAQHGTLWIQLARNAGIPVIFHLDDDLLRVPKSLGEEKYNSYNRDGQLRALRDNIDGCDLVYASTGHLADELRRSGIKVPVIAGDIYCSVDPVKVGQPVLAATGPVIGYMGSRGHAADLMMILPAIEQLLDSLPDLQFELFGTFELPDALLRFGPRVRKIAPLRDYTAFLERLGSLGWWIGLAPLVDNDFNRCKADTKWVEYSMAGMAVVASDLPVYQRACAEGAGVLAADPGDWYPAIRQLLRDRTLRDQMIATAQGKLRLTYPHHVLRRQVLDILALAAKVRTGFETGTGPQF